MIYPGVSKAVTVLTDAIDLVKCLESSDEEEEKSHWSTLLDEKPYLVKQVNKQLLFPQKTQERIISACSLVKVRHESHIKFDKRRKSN